MLTIDLSLSIIAAVLQLWVVARLFVMNRQREYPFFIAYNSLAILTFLAVLSVMRHPVRYYLTYWIGEIILSILALLVGLAVFKPAAEGIYARSPRCRLFLPLAVVAVITIALWETVYRPLRPTSLGHVASGMYSFVLGILCLEAIILGTCLALAFSKRIPWSRYELAIVSGFGLSALPKLISFLVWWNVGRSFETWVHYLVPASGIGAALIWVVAFSRSEPPTSRKKPEAGELQRLLGLMQEHTDFVIQILKDPPWRRQSLPAEPR